MTASLIKHFLHPLTYYIFLKTSLFLDGVPVEVRQQQAEGGERRADQGDVQTVKIIQKYYQNIRINIPVEKNHDLFYQTIPCLI